MASPLQRGGAPSLLAFCMDLHRRGLVKNTHPLLRLDGNHGDSPLAQLPSSLYAGFDPTASSLHLGNLLVVSQLLRSSALFDCKPVALVGGATALIGDPSGKDKERPQMSRDEVEENSRALTRQLDTLAVNAAEMWPRMREPLTIVDNIQWYEKMPVLDFLRFARSVHVGDMLRLGPIRSRLEAGPAGGGLSYTEFSYQIFQAYDWERLSRLHNCFLQLGGSDQLGNFETGREFIRAHHNSALTACGICLPLLVDKRGIKLGKTTIESTQEAATAGGGGIWLDKHRTSPYALYQYFRQLHDDEAERLLVYFSLRPMDGDDGLGTLIDEHRRNLGKWVAQGELANELTRLVHGATGLELAKRCSRLLFGNNSGGDDSSVEAEMEALPADSIRELFGPASTFHLSRHAIHTAGELADATYSDGSGAVQTRKTGVGAKRMLLGGFYLNGSKRLDPAERLDTSEAHLLQGRFSLVRWGRRRYALVEWSS